MIYLSIAIATRGKFSSGTQGITTAGKFPYNHDLRKAGSEPYLRERDYTIDNEVILMVIIDSVVSGALD